MALIEKAMPLSGGAGLNFSIVGGTEEPSNPKENTIWINTDVEIGEWQCSSTHPTTRADGTTLQNGDVRIEAVFSDVSPSINILKNNAMFIKIIAAYQYIGGSWGNKTTKIYQNNVWNNSGLVLYAGKSMNTDITGGWKEVESESITATQESDGIKFTYNGNLSIREAAVYTKKKIDLTNYSRLTAEIESVVADNDYLAAHLSLGITKYNTASNPEYKAKTSIWTYEQQDKTKVSLDISSFTGTYFIGIFADVAAGTINNIELW